MSLINLGLRVADWCLDGLGSVDGFQARGVGGLDDLLHDVLGFAEGGLVGGGEVGEALFQVGLWPCGESEKSSAFSAIRG